MEDVAAARAQDRRLYSKTGGKARQYNEKRKISLTIPFDATDRMNDPNGFCYFAGAYHVFFQYSPHDALGRTKYWGHYRSKNLTDWEYLGIAIRSDCPWDKDGAYSGCGFTEDGEMELFYTGNVKEEGEHDYIHSGRGANVIRTTRKSDDTGAVLQYRSNDKIHWEFAGEITTEETFGYMWECPDTFSLGGKTVLMCCPRGVERERFRFWNVHQSGYFLLDDREKENLGGTCKREQFHEFDNAPTIEEGWQHSLTLPRELTYRDGIVYQYPVEEINALREVAVTLCNGANSISEAAFDCEIHFQEDAGRKECLLDEDVHILWEDGILSVTLSKESGRGRGKREILLSELKELRILKDVSMLEIYVNHGEAVYTARYYPENITTTNVTITNSADARLYPMRKMEVESHVDTEAES